MKCDCFMKKIDQSDLEETLFVLRNYVEQGLWKDFFSTLKLLLLKTVNRCCFYFVTTLF